MDISQARKALQPLLDRYNQNKDNPAFTGLVHPYHQQGRVFGWEVLG